MKLGSFGLKASTDLSNDNEQLLILPSDSESDYEDLQINRESKILPPIKDDTPDIRTLAFKMFKGALPSMIQFFSALFVNNTTIHYISLKNDTTLYDGMSLGLNILNCFSFYLVFHSNIGFNAAASQALGAGNKRLVGLYLHRVFVIHLIVQFCAYIILLSAPFAFRAMGVDRQLTDIAFNYLILTPGYILGVVIFDTLKNYLYAHKIFNPMVIVQLIIAVIYWFLGEKLFLKLDWGIKGIVLAITISQWVGVLLLIIYLTCFKPEKIKDTWFKLSKQSFRDLWSLGKVMVTVGGMGYVEVFAYRIQSFSSMYFAKEQTAALTAFLAFGDLFYVLPVGISFPLISFIGSAMGSRNKKAIWKITNVTMVMSTVFLVILLGVFTLFKESFFSFYTQDPAVKDIMDKMGFLYYFTFPADFYQTLLAGVIKGIGKEKTGMKAFLMALYLIGVPMALLFSFGLKMEAPGMWLGNGIGIYAAMFFFMWVICRTDFNRQFDYIGKRVKHT